MSIDETVQLLRHNKRCTYYASVLPVISIATTPSILRILCNSILRCFGFTRVNGDQVAHLMNEIVWPNLAKLMTQSAQADNVGAGGFAGMKLLVETLSGITLSPATIMLKAPPVARTILKGACDLILILETAFARSHHYVTEEDIRKSSLGYKYGPMSSDPEGPSRRRLVHADIESLIPLRATEAFSMPRDRSIMRIRAEMEAVINKYRLTDDDGIQPASNMSRFGSFDS